VPPPSAAWRCCSAPAPDFSPQHHPPPQGGFFMSPTRSKPTEVIPMLTRSSLSLFALVGAVCMALVFSFHSPDAHAATASLLASLNDPGAALGALGFGLMGRTSIADLRDKRNTFARECNALLEKMGEKPSAEDTKAFDAKMDEIKIIDEQIKREQRLLDATAEKHFSEVEKPDNKAINAEATRIFNKLLRNGEKALTQEEWQVMNTMSTTTPSEGGFTVQTEVIKSVLEAMKAYGGMRQAAEVLRTAKGNPLNYPTSDGTSEEGEIIAENQTATDLDVSFGVISLVAYKYSKIGRAHV
jgi:hypothetical protein